MTLISSALHAMSRDVGPGRRVMSASIAPYLNLNNNVSLQQADD